MFCFQINKGSFYFQCMQLYVAWSLGMKSLLQRHFGDLYFQIMFKPKTMKQCLGHSFEMSKRLAKVCPDWRTDIHL